jgi:anaerobic selenocysteine-containing dehydrogenase
MQTSRGDFFKVAGVTSVAATVLGFNPKPAYAQLKELKIARANETRSTCPYCGGLRCPYFTIVHGFESTAPWALS